MTTQRLLSALAFIMFTGFGLSGLAYAEDFTLEPLSNLDKQYMANQVRAIDELVSTRLGQRIRGDLGDLVNLQRLLDLKIVTAGDNSNLQAMGIILGQLLADEHGVDWVIYIDKRGRSRALQIKPHREVIFPATMISRRVNGGASVDVKALYDKASATIKREQARPNFDLE